MTDLRQGPGPGGAPGVPGGAFRAAADAARFEAVLDNLNEIVFETDAEGNWTYLNQAWEKITGFTVHEALGRNFLEWVHPDEVEGTIQLFSNVVNGNLGYCHHETRYRTADGSHRWVELRSAVLYDEMGRIDGNAGVIMDISARRQAEDHLGEQARALEHIARGAPVEQTLGALAAHLARHLDRPVKVEMLARPDLLEPAGTGPGGPLVVTARPDGLLGVDDRPAAARAQDAMPEGRQTVVTGSDGRTVLGWIDVLDARLEPTASEDALIERASALSAIAMERHRAVETATHQALHDPLTDLPNRTLYTRRVHEAIAAGQRDGQIVALLMLDLDHFKMINEIYGHEAGDQVLRTMAARLRGELRAQDIACRLGGDEFVIVLSGLADAQEAWHAAERLSARMREPLDVQGAKLHLQLTMGVAMTAPDAGDPAGLLRQADAAMYRAKREGSGLVRYQPQRDAERLQGIDLARELDKALDNDEFRLYYQPKTDLRTGRIQGVEALLRWQHPQRGLLTPTMFIPLVETSAVIKPLTLWVLRTALADCRRWREQGVDIPVAVNLSARVLHDAELPDLVAGALAREQGDGRRLELEITESALMLDPARALETMAHLDGQGVTFTIDDYGTGYSSLAYLKQLPAGALKIDQSFVRDMDTDEVDAAIVRSAIDLGHNLGMEVVAEGVERRSVLHLLRDLGCDIGQGFDIGPPMPEAELLGWLRSRPEAPAAAVE